MPTPAEFARRRRQLMRMVGPEGLVIVPAAEEKIRNGDSAFPFRQDSDFLYLTGFEEPEALLVLAPGRKQAQSLLFCRQRDPDRERWDGPRMGLDGARSELGMDDAYPFSDIDEIVPGLMEGRERIHYAVGRNGGFDQRVVGWLNELRKRRRGVEAPEELISLEHALHDMRLFKSRGELTRLRRAARISARAISRAMGICRPGLNESDLHAELVHEYQRNRCPAAYQPIVAGGENALILHYVTNSKPLDAGDLVLIDAGCEVEGYAADISRTFPVSGTFSGPQKALYEIVLAAQAEAIDQVRPGKPWEEFHRAAVQVLCQGLVDEGLLGGNLDEELATESWKRFYMHKTGHWLGLDVHDVGDYTVDGHSRMLEKGMVLTVEPGLYIRNEADIPEAFRGIGIRIEDDVVVTDGDPEVLTSDVPRQTADIESLMAG